MHPEWQHTLPLDPVTVSFWDECCDAVLTQIAAGTLQWGGNDAHVTLATLMLVNQRCRWVFGKLVAICRVSVHWSSCQYLVSRPQQRSWALSG